MDVGLRNGDFASLHELQNKIRKDIPFTLVNICSENEDNTAIPDKDAESSYFLNSASVHHTEKHTSIYFGTDKNQICKVRVVCGSEPEELYPEMLELDTDQTDSSKKVIIQVTSSAIPASCEIVFVLDSVGWLHILCPFTMLEIFAWKEERVLEIVLLEDGEEGQLNLLLVTERPNHEISKVMDTYLQIRKYPSFCLVYELKVNSFCRPLAYTAGQECPLLIEGSTSTQHNQLDFTNTLSAMRIRGICEGNAELRLDRLLRRNKFHDAEVCATINNIDFEKIHQAKSSWLLSKLSPWKEAKCEETSEDNARYLFDLRCTLEKMTNLDYLVRCCVVAALPSLKDTRDILILARSVIQKHGHENDFDHALLSNVSFTLQRLETFIYTYQMSPDSECSRTPEKNAMKNMSSTDIIEKWSSFNRADMLVIIGQFLSQGKIGAALLVWQRHQAEFADRLNSEQIRLLLNLVKPEDMLSVGNKETHDMIFHWLSHFIPNCLKIVPECLPDLADWTVTAIKRLELKDRRNWPNNGIELAVSSLDAMHVCDEDSEGGSQTNNLKATRTPLTLHQQRTDKTSKLYSLTNLVENLYDLNILHTRLKIRIRLDDFIQDDKADVCTQLLDWCTTLSEVKQLLDEFLLQFIGRVSLNKKDILTRYCERLITDTGFCWYWELGSTAPWENKASTIIQYLSEYPDIQLKSILLALKYAPVPWSETIKELCAMGNGLPNSSLIKEQEKLVELKHILRKYDCKSFSVSGREAEAVLKKCVQKGGSYEEISVVANLLHGLDETVATKFFVQHLLESGLDNNKHNEAIAIILKVSEKLCFDELFDLADKFLIRAKLLYKIDFDALSTNSTLSESNETRSFPYLLFLKGFIIKLKSQYTKKDKEHGRIMELENRINQFANSCELRSCFGLIIPESCAIENSKKLIDDKINDMMVKDFKCNNAVDLGILYQNLQQLNMLSTKVVPEMTMEKMVSVVILILVKTKKYDLAVEATKLLEGEKNYSTDVTADVTNTLIDLILSINAEIVDTEHSSVPTEIYSHELPSILAHLASNAVTNCSEVKLIDNIHISKWQWLISSISQQFHNKTAFDKFQEAARSDGSSFVFDIWKFTPLYVDKTLPLSDGNVMLAPARFMTNLLSQNTTAVPYLPLAIFTSAIQSETQDYQLTLNKNEPTSLRRDLLESTMAVCALTPPSNSGRKNVSPIKTKFADHEKTLISLTNEILDHCHHYLVPMNQTVLVLESLIQAEISLMFLTCCSTNGQQFISYESTPITVRNMVQQEIQKVMPKIVSDNKPDLFLALGLLMSCDERKKGLKLLQTTISNLGHDDAEKLIVLGRVGMWYCSKSDMRLQFSAFRQLLVQSVWAKKMSSLGGNGRNVFSMNSHGDKMKVIQTLTNSNDTNLNCFGVKDVVSFSEAFEVDKTSTLLFYIKALLTSAFAEPMMETNTASRKEITSHYNKRFGDYISSALSTLPDNDRNETKLKLISDTFLNHVSPYNYEVLEFLLNAWKGTLQNSILINDLEEELEANNQSEISDETLLERKDIEEYNKDIDETLKTLIRFETMLKFMAEYERTEEPSPEEVDYWKGKRPGTRLPKIADKRLPFNFLSEKNAKESFKFLKAEFKLANLNQWLKIAKEQKYVFRHAPDNICIQTAQNEILALVNNSAKDSSDNRCSNWMEVLKGVEECLNQIAELYKATSTTHWILNRLPEDKAEERLFCARICRKYAEGWKYQVGDHDKAVEKGLNFAVTTQIRLEIEHILRVNRILDRPKQQLLQEFQQLEPSKIIQIITQVFDHPSIIDRARNVVDFTAARHNQNGCLKANKSRIYPNINDIVKEIVAMVNGIQKMFEINLDVIKYDLLDKWLKASSDTNRKSNFDDTVTNFDFKLMPGNCNLAENHNGQDEDNSNYLKCIYLLQGFENSKGIDYLLQIAMDTGVKIDGLSDNLTSNRIFVANSNVSTMQKLRSLKCLLSVATQEELDQIGCGIFQDEHFIEKKFHNYGFVSRLENLNLPAYDLESFEKCDKTTLIEGILRTCSYSAEGIINNFIIIIRTLLITFVCFNTYINLPCSYFVGISLMVDLCLSYKVFKPSLWTGLLGKMISQGLWKDIKPVLLELNGHPALWNLPIYLEAWNKMLSEPFTRASIPVTSEQKNSCFKALSLIKSCPIAADLDLKTLTGECKRIGLDALATELIEPLIRLTDLTESI